jgi:uncharacterized membrane-anchored protein YhcB (DUF1043 family)
MLYAILGMITGLVIGLVIGYFIGLFTATRMYKEELDRIEKKLGELDPEDRKKVIGI